MENPWNAEEREDMIRSTRLVEMQRLFTFLTLMTHRIGLSMLLNSRRGNARNKMNKTRVPMNPLTFQWIG